MGLQPARLKQENNISLLYMHRFCKVVTSGQIYFPADSGLYMHRFCKVVTSYKPNYNNDTGMYMHRFCKVVTSQKHLPEVIQELEY